jgi:hypothetical protein
MAATRDTLVVTADKLDHATGEPGAHASGELAPDASSPRPGHPTVGSDPDSNDPSRIFMFRAGEVESLPR